jgi:hypothetical protein
VEFNWVHSALRPPMAYCASPGWLWWWRNRWNDWQGKLKYSEKTCPSAALPTTNPTCCPDAARARRAGKLATNRLSYGTAYLFELRDSLRMSSSGMWRCVDLALTEVSEERIASIFRVEKSASGETAWAGGCRLSRPFCRDLLLLAPNGQFFLYSCDVCRCALQVYVITCYIMSTVKYALCLWWSSNLLLVWDSMLVVRKPLEKNFLYFVLRFTVHLGSIKTTIESELMGLSRLLVQCLRKDGAAPQDLWLMTPKRWIRRAVLFQVLVRWFYEGPAV